MMTLASCSPQRRLARLLEKHPLPEKVDTLYLPGETIYKPTTVFKYLPGEVSVESLYIDVPVSIPDTFIEAHTSTADAIAWLQNNKLGLQLIQYDTVIKWKIDSALVTHMDTVVVTKEKVVIKEVEADCSPFWRNATIILGAIVLLSILLIFLRRKT